MIKVRITRDANYLAKIPQEVLTRAIFDYLKAHDLPEESLDGEEVELFVHVPGGADWSDQNLILGRDTELYTKWSQHRTDDETVEVRRDS